MNPVAAGPAARVRFGALLNAGCERTGNPGEPGCRFGVTTRQQPDPRVAAPAGSRTRCTLLVREGQTSGSQGASGERSLGVSA